MNLTKSRLEKILSYNPKTGNLTWIGKPSRLNPYAGRIAGSRRKNGNILYIVIKIKGRCYQAHRLIFILMTGKAPRIIDHDDGDGTNNKWGNLKASNHHKNGMNSRLSKANTSGTTGVYWSKGEHRWKAQIMVNWKIKGLGTFTNKKDAIKARKIGEKKYNFHPNHGQKR